MQDYYHHRPHANVYQPKLKADIYAEEKEYGFDLITEINNVFYKQIVNLQDEAIREKLIELGWTPPEDA